MQFVNIQEDGVSIGEQSIEIDLLSPLENDRESDPIGTRLVLRLSN